MEPAGGNEAQNNVEEVRGEPEILARSLPSQPFAGAPTLNQGSLDQTPKLSGSPLVHTEQPERQESNQVKGERLNSECEPEVFNDLDLATYSDSFGTREGPSGLSSHSERLNHISDARNGLSHTLDDEQTVKKQPYEGIVNVFLHTVTGLQIYGGPGSLSHDLKIRPITFQGSGPSGPILFSCEKISL